jgi:pimeloyl-ACP methyl ester carboxylesterase
MLWLIIAALFSFVSPASADSFWQKLTWVTSDGVSLVGLYHPPSRPEALTWVLLHGLGSNKEEWDAFARKMAAQGSGVMIYDARGHGESVHGRSGETLTYQAWRAAGPGSPWDQMPSDLETAVSLLEKKYGLTDTHAAVGGASLGANVALVYASRHPKVPALILLSPGLEYAGIQSVPAFQAYGKRPLFIAASPGDAYAYASVQQMARMRGDAALRLAEGPAAEHGVNMFRDSEFTKKLLDWIKGLNGNRNRRPA